MGDAASAWFGQHLSGGRVIQYNTQIKIVLELLFSNYYTAPSSIVSHCRHLTHFIAAASDDGARTLTSSTSSSTANVRTYVRLLCQSFICLFLPSFVHSFFRSIVRSFVRSLFAYSRRHRRQKPASAGLNLSTSLLTASVRWAYLDLPDRSPALIRWSSLVVQYPKIRYARETLLCLLAHACVTSLDFPFALGLVSLRYPKIRYALSVSFYASSYEA
jgi:hypothetical protein